jgi:hypothetical protein
MKVGGAVKPSGNGLGGATSSKYHGRVSAQRAPCPPDAGSIQVALAAQPRKAFVGVKNCNQLKWSSLRLVANWAKVIFMPAAFIAWKSPDML